MVLMFQSGFFDFFVDSCYGVDGWLCRFDGRANRSALFPIAALGEESTQRKRRDMNENVSGE